MDASRWLEICSHRSNAELFAGLEALDDREAEMLAQILAHLATLEARKGAAETAYASLFVYCTRKLGYSEAEAYLRIRAARAALKYPRILTMIAGGHIHVTAVARVAPHLTGENYRSVLEKAGRRTQEELGRLIAELSPELEKRPVIRALSVGSNERPAAVPGASLFDAPFRAPGSGARDQASWPAAAAAAAVPDDAGGHSPLAPAGRVLFRFTGSEALRAKFKRARELLSHKYPRGLPEDIFDDALEALLDRRDPWRRMARGEKRRRRAAGGTAPDARLEC